MQVNEQKVDNSGIPQGLLRAIHPSGKYVTLAIEPRFRVSDIN